MTQENSDIRIKTVRREHQAAALPQSDPAGAPDTRLPDRPRGLDPRETKPFYLTSEFLLAALTILALLIAGYAGDDSLDTWRTWLLVTVVAAAYIVSRGIAKAGSADRR
jgi:hypothetical protein